MITCPKCQKELEDGTKFCDACGEKIVETIFCQNCGNATSTQYDYCQNCGAPLATDAAPVAAPVDAPVAAPAAAPKVTPVAPAKTSKKSPDKKLFVIGGATLAAVVLIVLILVVAFSGKEANGVAYIKDQEIQFGKVASKPKAWQVTDQLIDTNNIEDEDAWLANRAYDVGIMLSEDGKKMFYTDKYDGSDFTMYYRSATNPKKDPEKLDSDVSSWQINKKADLITYTKYEGETEEGVNHYTLYQHDLKEKDKIANDVTSWRASENGKTLIWKDVEGDLYMKKSGKDKVKLDSSISYIEHVDEDFKTVWYVKNDNLYKRVLSKKEEEKVVSDVSYVIAVYDSGAAYYYESSDEENEYDRTDTLYYFDGKKKVELEEDMYDWSTYSVDHEMLVYYTVDKPEIGDWKYEYFLALEGVVTSIKEDDAMRFRISEDGKAVYYLADLDEPADGETNKVTTGELKKLTISGTKVKKTEVYDKDVYSYRLAEDGTLTYYKDYDDEKGQGTLYADKEKVSDDVYTYTYCEETKDIILITDWNGDAEKKNGTLKYWNGKKLTKLSEDVHDFELTPQGEVLYLKDYDLEKNRGELYLSTNGKKSKKIDEDVVTILPIYVVEY